MIIEVSNLETTIQRVQLQMEIDELADEGHEVIDEHDDRRIGQEIATRKDELKKLQLRKLFIPDEVTEHQVHALQGTKWIAAEKPEPARTYPKQMSIGMALLCLLLMSALGGQAVVLDNLLGAFACAVIATLTIVGIAEELDIVKDTYHNYRIKRTDVSGIKTYQLNSRIDEWLQFKLGDETWSRLRNDLNLRDSELFALFTKFCEGKSLLLETVDEATTLLNEEPTPENQKRFKKACDMSHALTCRTATEIIAIYERRDTIAAEEEQAAKDKAEHEAFVLTVQQTFDAKFSIDAKLKFIEDAYNL